MCGGGGRGGGERERERESIRTDTLVHASAGQRLFSFWSSFLCVAVIDVTKFTHLVH
jgi:hypothetical protein